MYGVGCLTAAFAIYTMEWNNREKYKPTLLTLARLASILSLKRTRTLVFCHTVFPPFDLVSVDLWHFPQLVKHCCTSSALLELSQVAQLAFLKLGKCSSIDVHRFWTSSSFWRCVCRNHKTERVPVKDNRCQWYQTIGPDGALRCVFTKTVFFFMETKLYRSMISSLSPRVWWCVACSRKLSSLSWSYWRLQKLCRCRISSVSQRVLYY